MTLEDILIASFFILLLGSLIVIPILSSHKMKQALRETAAHLKAKPSDLKGEPGMFDVEAYETLVKGYRVRIAKGWKVYATGGKLVPLQGIYIEVLHSIALPFSLEIARKGTPIFPVCPTGDSEFDKKCVVASESRPDTVKFLGDPALRRLIQTFLVNQRGLARISSEAVTTRFINSWKGTPLLMKTIIDCARVAHAISKRVT